MAKSKNIEIIDYLIDYSKKVGKELVSNYTIAKLLDRTPREEGVKIYHKYAIDTEGFGNLTIARYCQNVEEGMVNLDIQTAVVGDNAKTLKLSNIVNQDRKN